MRAGRDRVSESVSRRNVVLMGTSGRDRRWRVGGRRRKKSSVSKLGGRLGEPVEGFGESYEFEGVGFHLAAEGAAYPDGAQAGVDRQVEGGRRTRQLGELERGESGARAQESFLNAEQVGNDRAAETRAPEGFQRERRARRRRRKVADIKRETLEVSEGSEPVGARRLPRPTPIEPQGLETRPHVGDGGLNVAGHRGRW